MTIMIIIGVIIILLFLLPKLTSKKQENVSKIKDFSQSDISHDIYISEYTNSIESNPYDATAYISRANRKSELNDKKGAIEDYNRAIELNPSDAMSYRDRAFVKKHIGDDSGAIQDLNKAILLEPDNWILFWNRGYIRYEAIRDQKKDTRLIVIKVYFNTAKL